MARAERLSVSRLIVGHNSTKSAAAEHVAILVLSPPTRTRNRIIIFTMRYILAELDQVKSKFTIKTVIEHELDVLSSSRIMLNY